MRVALYTRISTDEERQPFSLSAQEQRLRAYAASQDWTASGRPYADQASGASLDRPELARLLEAVRAGEIDVVLVYRVDRIARTLRGLVTLLEELDRVGVVFRSATEPFDTGSPAGRMMAQMLGVFAEFERATIIDRITAGMERKAARGEWQSGRRPHGYQVDRTTGHLMVDEVEAPQVAAIFDLYVRQRLSAAAVAKALTEQGWRTQTGKAWSARAVLTVLRNRVYLGEIYYRGTWHTAPAGSHHPPLVDREVFAHAQQLREARTVEASKRASNGSDYLLSGLLICSRCGKTYLGNAAHGRNARYRYYTCATRLRGGVTGCDADRLPADAVEDAVTASLIEALNSGNGVDDGAGHSVGEGTAHGALLAEAVQRLTEGANSHYQGLQVELAAARGELLGTRRRIDRYLTAFETETMPTDVCATRLAALGRQESELLDREAVLRQQLALATDQREVVIDLDRARAQLRGILATGPAQSVKALYRVLIDHVEIAPGRRIKVGLRY
jgi:site-specific DNA recombinase